MAAVCLIAGGLWVNDLVTPVHRVGVPTATVSRPAPVTPSSSPAATTSGTPGPSASAGPTSPASGQTGSPTIKPTGEFVTSSMTADALSSSGHLYRYVVAVETSTKMSVNTIAKQVAEVLNDPRGWAGSGRVRFALVGDREDADFTLYLSSPDTAKVQCGGSDEAEWACRSGGKVVINAVHWVIPARTYRSDAEGFQRFLVNHAVGHFLDQGHQACEKKGSPAPVMSLQGVDLDGCTPNPWPNG